MRWFMIGYPSLVGIAAVIILVDHFFCLDSQAWAGWVQAIGSIAAIFGAFYIGKHQADIQMRVAELDRQNLLSDRHSTIKGVIDRAYQLCLNIEPHLEGEKSFGNLAFLVVYREESFSRSIKLLEDAPLYEFGSGELLDGVLDLRDAMLSIRGWIQMYHEERNGPEDSITVNDDTLRAMLQSDMADARCAYQKIIGVTGGSPRTEPDPPGLWTSN